MRHCWGTTPISGEVGLTARLHPLRRAAPVTSRYTRSERVHCLRIGCTAYGSGALPTDRVHCLRIGCTAYGSGAAPPVTRTNAEAARRGPGCSARGWRQGLAGLRGDAPSEARSADGSRAGRHPRAHRAARPTQTNNTAPRNQARRQASPPAPHNEAATGFPATASARSISATQRRSAKRHRRASATDQAVMST